MRYQLLLLPLLLVIGLQAAGQPFGEEKQEALPFSVNKDHITVWNGRNYKPVFINGVNLGVSIPGTFPGQLAASQTQYEEWIARIREAGFNSIRLYTLHFPRFYEALANYNANHPQQPVYIFQGIWLEGTIPDYNHDLFFLSDTFQYHIRQTVNCIHGNEVIPERPGKAYGEFLTDVSPWVMGYIMGREVHPHEVQTTSANHENTSSFTGDAFRIDSGSAAEVWVTRQLDELVTHERSTYGTQRPVSFSSWPTLDPLEHPSESSSEDVAEIDFTKIQSIDAPAGHFASFHAYPYYPDFISNDSAYQHTTDYGGQNSYVAYLQDMKAHFDDMPLIIAEYGTASSWGIAHHAQSGMHHGGFTEQKQGRYYIRMLHNIRNSGCGGGMQFAWIDEWFKRTWITDPIDFDNYRRRLWHNICAAEQNFGLLGFRKPDVQYQALDNFSNKPVSWLKAGYDYAFLRFRFGLNQPMTNTDTVWIGLDTYGETLGERVMPTGDTISHRAEFALRITNYDAELYVTEAYDLHGIWHHTAGPEQLFRSVPTTGEPWHIVRWKNNAPEHDNHYIGDLRIRRTELPASSKDAVVIANDSIDIRLPWSLIHVTDPSASKVLHDYRSTPEREDTVSQGIAFTIIHNNTLHASSGRYQWGTWNVVSDYETYEKQSLKIMERRLPDFNNPPFAESDTFNFSGSGEHFVSAENGLLQNDFDMNGNSMQAEMTTYTKHGTLQLNSDGSFAYNSVTGYSGRDTFSYRVFDGMAHSDTCTVHISTEAPVGLQKEAQATVRIYPNPASSQLRVIKPHGSIARLTLINEAGKTTLQQKLKQRLTRLIINHLEPGLYFARIQTARQQYVQKIVIR